MIQVIFFSSYTFLAGIFGAFVGQYYMAKEREKFMQGKCYASIDNQTYEVIVVVIDFEECFIKDEEKQRLLNDEKTGIVFK